MKSCRTASLFATGALLVAGAIAACRDAASPEIPPVTSALPPPLSGVASAPSTGDAAPGDDAGSPSFFAAATAAESPVTATFVDAPGKIEAPICSRLLIAVAKGKVIAMGETLGVGDVLVVTHPEPIKLEGTGLVVLARRDFDTDVCGVKTRPALDKKIVRASSAADLRWAGGGMGAHLDVGVKLSPDVYLGRLEGTAGVAEHVHAGSWEILAAIEASGTFVLDGTEGHLGPRQIMTVPPGSKHAWKPDPGSKLVAIQMYSPPGPEQRFVTLAAADKDAGSRDAH
jgi:mannose-6-phosphate isomerase-like protein (cupin superfamily)